MARNSVEAMETDQHVERKKIHFGSLEEVERERLKQQQQGGAPVISPAVLAGIRAGNINMGEGMPM